MKPDEDDRPVVNVMDYCRSLGLSEATAVTIIMRLIVDESYAYESDIRRAAKELGHDFPYFPTLDNGQVH